MLIQSSYKLRLKVLLGLVLFLLLFLLYSGLQWQILEKTVGNTRVLGELTKLEESTVSLAHSSNHYEANAPRDYQSYDRDLVIFLAEIEHDLDRLDAHLLDMEVDITDHVRPVLPALFNALADQGPLQSLRQSIADVREQWQTLLSGYREKLGTDEPKLEWGAEYMADNLPGFEVQVMTMGKQFRQFLGQQQQLAERVSGGGIVFLTLIGLMGLLWFYWSVVRRIGQTANACVRVANGDFGYTLKSAGSDELTQLSRAFNLVSSRSQLTVKLLTNMADAQSVDEALQAIIQASGSYLPVAWIGVMQVERGQTDSGIRLFRTMPAISLDGWERDGPDTQGQLNSDLFNSQISAEPLLINDVKSAAQLGDADPFLRDLARTTQITSLVILPLNSETGWQGFLLFGSRRAEYRPDQIGLLKSLSRALAITLQRLIS